eukprot:TRINITY_DN8195_c0_g1_i2.p1 TRINITY_DN8195_c0_g1~~TRINITY_DN8195_c0_g1_i2.p1  ORF type:complete len:248 (+),score=46.48 TRINITY_DN8195_c0_g1_i2:212-955(+)
MRQSVTEDGDIYSNEVGSVSVFVTASGILKWKMSSSKMVSLELSKYREIYEDEVYSESISRQDISIIEPSGQNVTSFFIASAIKNALKSYSSLFFKVEILEQESEIEINNATHLAREGDLKISVTLNSYELLSDTYGLDLCFDFSCPNDIVVTHDSISSEYVDIIWRDTYTESSLIKETNVSEESVKPTKATLCFNYAPKTYILSNLKHEFFLFRETTDDHSDSPDTSETDLGRILTFSLLLLISLL